MASFKARIIAEAKIEKISVGDLIPDREYNVLQLSGVLTKYARTIVAVMEAGEEDRRVFFPRAVQMSDPEIEEFNTSQIKDLQFIYIGKNNNIFSYKLY